MALATWPSHPIAAPAPQIRAMGTAEIYRSSTHQPVGTADQGLAITAAAGFHGSRHGTCHACQAR